MLSRKRYRSGLAAWLLLLYVLYAGPSSLWHHHLPAATGTHAKFEKPTFTRGMTGHQAGHCDVCQHQPVAHEGDHQVFLLLRVPYSLPEYNFPPASPLHDFLEEKSNKGPPALG